MTHAWSPPTEIAFIPVSGEAFDELVRTSTGLVRRVVEPSPTWPEVFAPQHFTAPPVRRAQPCSLPAEIARTPVSPETATGVLRVVVEPSPTWPELFAPQHLTDPVDNTRQVKFWPADKDACASSFAEPMAVSLWSAATGLEATATPTTLRATVSASPDTRFRQIDRVVRPM